MAIRLNVHGNEQYETVVAERVAKYEQHVREELAAAEAEQNNLINQFNNVNDTNGQQKDDDENLLATDTNEVRLYHTNYLLPNSYADGEKDHLNQSAPDKQIGDEERKVDHYSNHSNLQSSMVDV